MIVASSCKESETSTEQTSDSGSEIFFSLTASVPQLSEHIDGYPNILWKEGATIGLFDYTGKNNPLTMKTTSSITSEFSGTVNKSDSYHAFYPYDESISLKYGLFPINIQMFQTQSSYGLLDLCGPLYVLVENGVMDVTFERINTLLSFSMPSSAPEIRTVIITDKGGRPLAGSFNFNVKNLKCEPTPESISKVVLIDEFETGKHYYVNVASVDGVFQTGVKFEFINKKGESCTLELDNSKYSIKDKFVDFGELPIGSFSPKFTIDDCKLPGKKGVCAKTMMSKVVAQKPWWNYTWKIDYYSDQPKNVEFIPMTWGGFNPNVTLPYIQRLIDDGKITRVLGFNEPDKADQSNMTVDRALELWPYLESLGVPLGSPATAKHPVSSDWFKAFMNKVKEKGYRVDFVCVHDYGGGSVDAFKTKLTSIYNTYDNRPILVTEFAVADWTAEKPENNKHSLSKVKNFMNGALDWMEQNDFVLGYAWFSFGVGEAAGTTSALFDKSNNLTELGKFYSDYKSN